MYEWYAMVYDSANSSSSSSSSAIVLYVGELSCWIVNSSAYVNHTIATWRYTNLNDSIHTYMHGKWTSVHMLLCVCLCMCIDPRFHELPHNIHGEQYHSIWPLPGDGGIPDKHFPTVVYKVTSTGDGCCYALRRYPYHYHYHSLYDATYGLGFMEMYDMWQ